MTPWNAAKLRDAIINGPDINPGATHVVDNSAPVKLKSSRKDRISAARKLLSSKGAAGKHSDSDFEGKFVYRHLQDGDIVLVNRQVKFFFTVFIFCLMNGFAPTKFQICFFQWMDLISVRKHLMLPALGV